MILTTLEQLAPSGYLHQLLLSDSPDPGPRVYKSNDTLGPELCKITGLLTHVPDCTTGYVGASGNANAGVCVSHCGYLSPHQYRQYVNTVPQPNL